MMSVKSSDLNVLPGASSLGYGVNIATALTPTTVTAQVIALDEENGTEITKFGNSYLLPANVTEIDVNNNDISFSSFTSESQYSRYMSAQASVSASAWGFSAQFDTSYSSLEQGDNTVFWGLVEAHSTLWTTQLKSITGNSLNPDFVDAVNSLPAVFNVTTQQQFFSFFDQWGTHVINQSTVGGSLNYCVTSDNTSGLTQQAAAASMQFEYDSLFVDASGSAQADWNNMSSNWIASRKADLQVVGGTPDILNGAIIPTSPTWTPDYSSSNLVATWTAGLPANPGVIGTTLTPISNVLTGYASDRATAHRAQASARQLTTALAVYLDAPISVLNESTFEMIQGFPTLVSTSTSMPINESVLTPPNPPRLTDLSLYWIVLVDGTGTVQFNQNSNSEDPDVFDTLVQQAEQAAQGQTWWACICIVNQEEAPLSSYALNWLDEIGCSATNTFGGGYYPNMACVATMIGKTNSNYQNGEQNYYQPWQTYFGWDGDTIDITVGVAVPAFVNNA